MKKNIIKYSVIVIGILISIIIYLSLIGIETDKFNDSIKDKISQNNKIIRKYGKINLKDYVTSFIKSTKL